MYRLLATLSLTLFVSACQNDESAIEAKCPATGTCTVTLDSGETVSLELKGELTAMAPIELKVSSSSPINEARVVFTGVDMNMGILPFELTITDTDAQGIGRVASCTEPTMTWQAQYQLTLNGESYRINRQFVVEQ